MASLSSRPPNVSLFSGRPASSLNRTPLLALTRPDRSPFRCLVGQARLFTRLGRYIKEKAKSDVKKIFSRFMKTRDILVVIDELLLYWNLAETDRILDERSLLLCPIEMLFALSSYSNMLSAVTGGWGGRPLTLMEIVLEFPAFA